MIHEDFNLISAEKVQREMRTNTLWKSEYNSFRNPRYRDFVPCSICNLKFKFRIELFIQYIKTVFFFAITICSLFHA